MPKPSKSPKPAAAKPSVPEEAAKAYAEVKAEIESLPTSALLPINVDIPRAVAIGIGAVPHLAKLRDQAAKLPDFNIQNIDKIGPYALAAWHAHLTALPELSSTLLGKLLEEAKPLREDMLLAAELMAHKGYFDKRSVEAIRSGQGNLDTANDLVALSALYAASWDQVEKRSPVTWEEVERASLLGPQLLIALGERRQPVGPDAGVLTAVELRQRAFSLFANAYDQCRRAVSYLRWNDGDAEEVAPSLYTRTRRDGSQESPEPAPVAPVTPQ
ncbi:MAG: hypothetical protein IPK82_13480 [Polyangiaceae bacterium]|nr:hypothetical protein [Polyangiaceae bacterium]